ncbi:antibiotic biosynthesis monooxygenase family protein [Nitrosophilus alvini]|uniref:antibiotic biosynthesis monooxygenase family protein n=1 Tax=Nitrosophilus alvini TaxID=2714855 RepID=UPI00190CCC6C|nr:antibiotic biosynthesis monooxygenase [Nitrosophilus alvini]
MKKIPLGKYAAKHRLSRYQVLKMTMKGELAYEEVEENGRKTVYILEEEDAQKERGNQAAETKESAKLASTPKPPYYAVIFTSQTGEDIEGFQEMAKKMTALASEQEGFLGIESARSDIGITVSYWKDLESIRRWRENSEHRLAQKQGQQKWYKRYKIRIAKVESEKSFE